jgi:predicted small secreted protein
MKSILSSLLISLFVLTGLTACNTVEGVGEDLQSIGRKTEDAAN